MRNAHKTPDPAAPRQTQPSEPPSAQDPADLGTAYGMELSIDSVAKQAPAEDDVDDPLGWIRRWLEAHKPPN